MRILFVNHTSVVSGAELALIRLVETLRRDHHVAVACPPAGPLGELVDGAGIRLLPVPAFEASLRLHPMRTPVGLARLALGGSALARAARRLGAEVLHANSPRAGLMGVAARGLGGPPLVVRAHEHVPLSATGRLVRFALVRTAGAVVAVSRDTAERFNEGLQRPVATHVYNSFDRARLDAHPTAPAGLREELQIAPDAALLGQVAQITPWKGQDTAIRALAELRGDGMDAHLLLVGRIVFAGKGVRHDNHAYLRELHRLVDELALRDAVHFLGQRDDAPAILRAIDLSLLPSWNEPFANVMLESMAVGTPLVVSDVGGAPELVEDGASGRLLPPRRPDLWATALRELLADRTALERMGDRAQAATARFGDERHAGEMLAVYERVLAASRRSPARPAAARRAQRRAST